MTVAMSDLKSMTTKERANAVAGAKQRRAELRQIPVKEFQAMHPDQRKAIQSEVSQCDLLIANAAVVRDTQE